MPSWPGEYRCDPCDRCGSAMSRSGSTSRWWPRTPLRLSGAKPNSAVRDNEVEHGSDQDGWPHRHPGIVLTAVPSIAHGACLGRQWRSQPGNSMSVEGWWEAAAAVARRHEGSHGEFRGEPDQLLMPLGSSCADLRATLDAPDSFSGAPESA
jgi:hypothetical protein